MHDPRTAIGELGRPRDQIDDCDQHHHRHERHRMDIEAELLAGSLMCVITHLRKACYVRRQMK
jgi:hypothetical protein